ncbi:MFS transporter [Halegenticoccus soli]|uniref:MFS transporter n=1 Tax=Halegenticoccus soli TaxID=1985678 RepID=UPI000C6E1359|nr:MFS transporter [Halegenticoccus soli]
MSGSVRRDRATLAFAVWAVLVSQVLLYPGVADLVAALGAPPDIASGMWFLVAEFAAFVVCAGLWGALSDAVGRRVPLIVVGAVGGAAGYLSIAAAPSFGLSFGAVLALRAVGGALTIGAFSLAVTMLMDLAGGHGRNMGAAGIAIGLGAALGAIAGGRLTAVDPLAPLYAAAALLCLVAAAAATVEDRAPDGRRVGVGAVLSRLADRPALSVPYAFGFIDRLTAGFFALVGVYYFRDAFGLDAAAAGSVLALFFFPFALLQYPMGVLSDRIGRFLPVVAGSALYGASIVAVGAAPALELAAGLMVLVGVFGALVAPATMALVTDLADPGERGAAMGGFNVFGSLGFLTGFLVGGTVADAHGYLPAFVVVGLLEVAIAALALRAVRRIAPDPDNAEGGLSGA